MRKKRCPELLAPAGSFQTLEAVIQAGADAVYAGGSRFGARAYAHNFDKEELSEAIDYAHLYGRRLYLTVNTLLKQPETEQLYDYLAPYYEQGLDAVIVQDFGVLCKIREWFPKLSVHVSTQMSVSGIYGVSYLSRLGAVRVVPSRELSLDEIRAIRSQTKTELECFVHGALCYCYSGQCLFSSLLGGRSGNRGRCAQPCRLPYTAYDAKNRRRISDADAYLLSPKDLCTIRKIPDFIEAGIDSFKIEGRMKSAEYAAAVTSVYRKYIDLYINTGRAQVSKQDEQKLLFAGNRSGFTDGYYSQRNGADMITVKRPNHEKTAEAGLHILQTEKLPVRAKAFLKAGRPAELTVSCGEMTVSVQGETVQRAENQPVSREMASAQLSKTGDTRFVMRTMEVVMEEPVFMPKKAFNQLRRKALEQLQERMLSGYRRTLLETAGIKTENASGCRNAYQSEVSGCYFTAVIEEPQQLSAVLAEDFISRVYLDSAMYTRRDFTVQLKEHAKRIKSAGKQAYFAFPPVFRKETAQFYQKQWEAFAQCGIDGFLVKNQDECGFLEEMKAEKARCVSDHSLYTYSDAAKNAYRSKGWIFDTVPLELNKKELSFRDNSSSELIIYGYMPLMTSAQCVSKTLGRCTKTRGLCYLKDRYAKELPVRNNCSECYNTIYNAQPLSLIQLADELPRLHPAAYRLWFTIESTEKTAEILTCCKKAFFDKACWDREVFEQTVGAYTNGHYKRGVQ